MLLYEGLKVVFARMHIQDIRSRGIKYKDNQSIFYRFCKDEISCATILLFYPQHSLPTMRGGVVFSAAPMKEGYEY